MVGASEQVRARDGFGLSLDQVIWMERASRGGSNAPIDSRFFFAQDALGSVVAVTDDRMTEIGSAIEARITQARSVQRERDRKS